MSTSMLSILSLMFGVFGMCLSCIFIGIFPCVLSVILGCIALKNDMSYKWPSICGIVCSAVGIIMAVVVMTQSESWNTPNVATPTEVVQNYTNSSNDNSGKSSKKSEQIYDNQSSTLQAKESSSADTEVSGSSDIIDMDFSSFSVTYVDYAIATDYEGNPCVIIYYDFTNNSDDAQSAMMSAYMQVYQNGVQCNNALISDDNDYINNYSKNVMKGTTIRVGEAFSISDRSDIDVIMKEAFSFSNNSDDMKIKLN